MRSQQPCLQDGLRETHAKTAQCCACLHPAACIATDNVRSRSLVHANLQDAPQGYRSFIRNADTFLCHAAICQAGYCYDTPTATCKQTVSPALLVLNLGNGACVNNGTGYCVITQPSLGLLGLFGGTTTGLPASPCLVCQPRVLPKRSPPQLFLHALLGLFSATEHLGACLL